MLTGFRFEPEQDVDAMWEADAAAEWERINEPDPDSEKYIEASTYMEDAFISVSAAMDAISDAAKEAEDTAGYDRIISLLDDLSDLQCELMCMKNKMKEGEIA